MGQTLHCKEQDAGWQRAADQQQGDILALAYSSHERHCGGNHQRQGKQRAHDSDLCDRINTDGTQMVRGAAARLASAMGQLERHAHPSMTEVPPHVRTEDKQGQRAGKVGFTAPQPASAGRADEQQDRRDEQHSYIFG